MKYLAKKIIPYLPAPARVLLFRVYESYFAYKSRKFSKEIAPSGNLGKIVNILFFHPSGLSFGGTEKFLQILAKYIDKKKYNIFYMYSNKIKDSDGRKYYLENQNIKFIPFSYNSKHPYYPFILEGMRPDFSTVLRDQNIDLIITAGSGYSEFPFNIVSKLPIIMLNTFGSPSAKKNIIKHICISKEVANKISNVVPDKKIEIMYIPSEKPSPENSLVRDILTKFNIKPKDTVFGRIGRASDEIFDPIGIRAFKKVVAHHPDSHYIIMSAPPILQKIVKEENIPNVHFLESSYHEKDVWAFHGAIDVLAHFRNDGESCGLNIIESMLSGNPIITHKSHIWNAHLEYLKPTFSRVAEKDDVEEYAKYMEEMIKMKQDGSIQNISLEVRKYAESMFLIPNNISKLEQIIDDYDNNTN